MSSTAPGWWDVSPSPRLFGVSLVPLTAALWILARHLMPASTCHSIADALRTLCR